MRYGSSSHISQVRGWGFFVFLPIYLNHFIEYDAIQETLCAIDVLAYQSKEGGGVYFVYLK